MSVLYRKYRPQTLAQVVGQKYIVKTLKNQVGLGMLSHAYLFTGSRGVGKTSVARILAKAVNCEKHLENSTPSLSLQTGQSVIDVFDACGECKVCKAVEAGNFIDLVEIDAASNTGVDNVREMIEHTRFVPAIGKYKVFIIDEVHMLSKGAFNALLKTLEEPPKHVIFILATTEIAKLPATVISRTQRFDFALLKQEEIAGQLKNILAQENVQLDPEIVDMVALRAEGGMRDGLSLLEKILTLGPNPGKEECRLILGVTSELECVRLYGLIADPKASLLPAFFENLAAQGVDFEVFVRDFLEFLRKILVKKITGQKETEHGSISLPGLIFLSRLFIKAYKDLSSSPDPELPVLLAAIEAALKFKSSKQSPLAAPASEEKDSHIEKEAETKNDTDSEKTKKENLFEGDFSHDPVPVTANFSFSLDEVVGFWPAVLDKVRNINSPLANLVRTSELVEVSQGQAILAVKFPFHKQSIETNKNREIIRNAILEVCGKPMGIAVRVVKEEVEISSSSPVEAISQALKVFGGEVVE